MSSAAVEDYVKMIYRLQAEGQPVTTSALAEALHVSPASATGMVKKLQARKLVHHSPYRDIELTRAGEKVALQVIRHHRLLELFLQETLEMPWDRVHAEAERMEHILSDELEDRIAAKLGNPVEDPHGDPIPTKSGRLANTPLTRLSDLPAGASATIKRVGTQSPEQLRYLSTIGLTPNVRVQMIEQLPFEGPVRLRLGSRERVLDSSFARHIWVRRR